MHGKNVSPEGIITEKMRILNEKLDRIEQKIDFLIKKKTKRKKDPKED